MAKDLDVSLFTSYIGLGRVRWSEFVGIGHVELKVVYVSIELKENK